MGNRVGNSGKSVRLYFWGFNINVFDDGKFLLPIFTMGKYFGVSPSISHEVMGPDAMIFVF